MFKEKRVLEAQSDIGQHGSSDAFYRERTDRNIGWLTQEEQEMLRGSTVAIAGCGGMGGLVASIMTRLGIGEIRIADSEVFDISNINRQYAARIDTIGVSKADTTARDLRAITTDMKLVVYPCGITRESADDFVHGCDLICDEIEFWAAGSRIMLHQAARRSSIPLFTCTSVGFGTRLLYFGNSGAFIESMLGMQLPEAERLERSIYARTATNSEVERVLLATLEAIAPELPRYARDDDVYDDRTACMLRLRTEQRASILASNPPLAAGFLANHILLKLLARSERARRSIALPDAPGYLYFDAALMIARCVERRN